MAPGILVPLASRCLGISVAPQHHGRHWHRETLVSRVFTVMVVNAVANFSL